MFYAYWSVYIEAYFSHGSPNDPCYWSVNLLSAKDLNALVSIYKSLHFTRTCQSFMFIGQYKKGNNHMDQSMFCVSW